MSYYLGIDIGTFESKGVIVDGVYSMRGDTSPIPEILDLVEQTPNAFLFDDEAHGLGVLGAQGRGAAEHYGVLDRADIITVTFSKTLGSCGGAVIGNVLVYLDDNHLTASYSASMAPVVEGDVLAALGL